MLARATVAACLLFAPCLGQSHPGDEAGTVLETRADSAVTTPASSLLVEKSADSPTAAQLDLLAPNTLQNRQALPTELRTASEPRAPAAIPLAAPALAADLAPDDVDLLDLPSPSLEYREQWPWLMLLGLLLLFVAAPIANRLYGLRSGHRPED